MNVSAACGTPPVLQIVLNFYCNNHSHWRTVGNLMSHALQKIQHSVGVELFLHC